MYKTRYGARNNTVYLHCLLFLLLIVWCVCVHTKNTHIMIIMRLQKTLQVVAVAATAQIKSCKRACLYSSIKSSRVTKPDSVTVSAAAAAVSLVGAASFLLFSLNLTGSFAGASLSRSRPSTKADGGL